MGKKPSEATVAVSKTGRKRLAVPRSTTCINGAPDLRSELNSAIRTMPLRTATPNRAIKPTPAEIEKGIPLIYKAITPPIEAKGIAE